jgi:hypothetical protein
VKLFRLNATRPRKLADVDTIDVMLGLLERAGLGLSRKLGGRGWSRDVMKVSSKVGGEARPLRGRYGTKPASAPDDRSSAKLDALERLC